MGCAHHEVKEEIAIDRGFWRLRCEKELFQAESKGCKTNSSCIGEPGLSPYLVEEVYSSNQV